MPVVVFRTVKSKNPFRDTKAFERHLRRGMDREVKPALLDYFERIVKPWDTKVGFRARTRIRRRRIEVSVHPTGPNAKIWGYVTKGTPPHLIRPKRKMKSGGRAAHLSFVWGGPGSYKPHTRPGGRYKGPGKVVGGRLRHFFWVRHPGSKARNFEKHIARWYYPKFRRTMHNMMRRALRAAAKG